MRFTSLSDIEHALAGMDELIKDGRTCKTPRFYKPFHFVLLALTIQRAGWDGIEMTDDDAEFAAYAARMHLWDALKLEPPFSVNKFDETGRFHPLTRLDDPDTVEEVSSQLSHLFDREGAESVRSIDIAVSELVGNSYAHSDIAAGLRGLVCAQKWTGGRKAQIAIGDCGIGVRRSLELGSEYQNELATENACELATRYEVTSKRGKGHSGYGLTLARQLLENNGGAFFLLSNSEYYSACAGNVESGKLATPLLGTIAIMEWNTDIPLSARAVYDSWPTPDEDEIDDFNF